MKLPKLIKIACLLLCINLSVPSFSYSIVPVKNPVSQNTPVTSTDPLARLLEIKEMSKENLSRADKKKLRKEVKAIKKEMKAERNGVYLSVGAIIIIILLLILLL